MICHYTENHFTQLQILEGFLPLHTIPVKLSSKSIADGSTENPFNGVLLRLATNNSKIGNLR